MQSAFLLIPLLDKVLLGAHPTHQVLHSHWGTKQTSFESHASRRADIKGSEHTIFSVCMKFGNWIGIIKEK